MYLSCFFFIYIYIIFSVCTVELSSSFSLAAYGDSEMVNSLKTGVISDSNVYVSWYHYETGHQTGFLWDSVDTTIKLKTSRNVKLLRLIF